MSSFEIVRGDYGRVYRGTIEDENLSDCTAVVYVWDKDDNKIVDGKTCSISFVSPDTLVDFTPALGDFDVVVGTYYGLFKFTKTGVVERTLSFIWKVIRKEP